MMGQTDYQDGSTSLSILTTGQQKQISPNPSPVASIDESTDAADEAYVNRQESIESNIEEHSNNNNQTVSMVVVEGDEPDGPLNDGRRRSSISILNYRRTSQSTEFVQEGYDVPPSRYTSHSEQHNSEYFHQSFTRTEDDRAISGRTDIADDVFPIDELPNSSRNIQSRSRRSSRSCVTMRKDSIPMLTRLNIRKSSTIPVDETIMIYYSLYGQEDILPQRITTERGDSNN